MSTDRTVAEGWIPLRHGTTSSYLRGCRCLECTKHNVARANRHRQARMDSRVMLDGRLYAADASTHGSHTTYSNWGCRCIPCSDDHATRLRARKQSRRVTS